MLLSFSSSQGPQVTITKKPKGRPLVHVCLHHEFRKGGSSPMMDAKYRGPCCGGTRKPGDGKPATCMASGCNYSAYLCAKCRKPLKLTAPQCERMAANLERAEDLRMITVHDQCVGTSR